MAMKGKEVMGNSSKGKRKLNNDEEGNKCRRTRRSNALQFFDASAIDTDNEDDDDEKFEIDSDFHEFADNIEIKSKSKSGSDQVYPLKCMLKEEELSGDELEELVKHKYICNTKDDTCVDNGDEFDDVKPSFDSTKDPSIWKVKCMVGHERQSVFCLIQKYIDLNSLGTKLQVRSSFSLDDVKGYIYIEADRECDITEACKGLCNVYSSRMSRIPINELSYLFRVRDKVKEVHKGMWVRVKQGTYKGDIALVVAVDDVQQKAVIKLIPRIDLQAMARKLGGGITIKKAVAPAPRLIGRHDLEDFRSHIQLRRDRLTGELFEIFDGLMLKDGFLYKKVLFGSLSYSGVQPTVDELQKFSVTLKDTSLESKCLSMFPKGKPKHPKMTNDKVKDKSASTSKCEYKNEVDLYDLVLLGRKEFGMVVSIDDDKYQILKGVVEQPEITTIKSHEVKNVCCDKSFTAQDRNMITIRINDLVKVLEGPFQGNDGIVRHMYKGIIFVYDDNMVDNSGIFCAKSGWCEKLKSSVNNCKASKGKTSGWCFDDSNPFHENSASSEIRKDRKGNGRFQGDRDQRFSIGQTLRIRVGPLKGHICRVISIFRSEANVKLESQPRIITVNLDHLSEAGVKIYGNSSRDFATDGSDHIPSSDAADENWLKDKGKSESEHSGWDLKLSSTFRESWNAFSASVISVDAQAPLENPFDVGNEGKRKGDNKTNSWIKKTDASWDNKLSNTWGNSLDGQKQDSWSIEKSGGWEKKVGSKSEQKQSVGWGAKAIENHNDMAGTSGVKKQSDGWSTIKNDSWDKKDDLSKKTNSCLVEETEKLDESNSAQNPSSRWSMTRSEVQLTAPWGSNREDDFDKKESSFGNKKQMDGWAKSEDKNLDKEGSTDGDKSKPVSNRGLDMAQSEERQQSINWGSSMKGNSDKNEHISVDEKQSDCWGKSTVTNMDKTQEESKNQEGSQSKWNTSGAWGLNQAGEAQQTLSWGSKMDGVWDKNKRTVNDEKQADSWGNKAAENMDKIEGISRVQEKFESNRVQKPFSGWSATQTEETVSSGIRTDRGWERSEIAPIDKKQSDRWGEKTIENMDKTEDVSQDREKFESNIATNPCGGWDRGCTSGGQKQSDGWGKGSIKNVDKTKDVSTDQEKSDIWGDKSNSWRIIGSGEHKKQSDYWGKRSTEQCQNVSTEGQTPWGWNKKVGESGNNKPWNSWKKEVEDPNQRQSWNRLQECSENVTESIKEAETGNLGKAWKQTSSDVDNQKKRWCKSQDEGGLQSENNWKRSEGILENPWKNKGLDNEGQHSGWKRSNSFGRDQNSWKKDNIENWNSSKGLGDRDSSSGNLEKMDEDGTVSKNGWHENNSFDRGCGRDGRGRGRRLPFGGGRSFGRSNNEQRGSDRDYSSNRGRGRRPPFGQGRSFSRGSSFGISNQDGGNSRNWGRGGMPPSSWNNSKEQISDGVGSGSYSENLNSTWKADKIGSWTSGWNRDLDPNKEESSRGKDTSFENSWKSNQFSDKGQSSNRMDQNSGWKSDIVTDSDQKSTWGAKSSSNRMNQNSGWKSEKATDSGQKSTWGTKSQESAWNQSKVSVESSSSGWNALKKDKHSYGEATFEPSNQNDNWNQPTGSQSSNWKKTSDWENAHSVDSWNKPKSWDTGEGGDKNIE